MRIQPRQHLLDVLHALSRRSYRDAQWRWGDRDGANSVTDAKQLLCLLGPATSVPSFQLDRPDQTDDELVSALRAMGTAVDIPRLLTRVLTDFFTRYRHDKVGPVFAAHEPEPDGTPAPDLTESFAVSVTLSLGTIAFSKVFERAIARVDLREEVLKLERLASERLSAAMVGLLRSFSVSVFEPDSEYGRILLRQLNQANEPQSVVLRRVQEELRQVGAGLRDVFIGSGQVTDLVSPYRLFECGWTWGVVEAAPVVETTEPMVQSEGGAEDRPSLYFTVTALDAIEELFSERTRLLGLLSEEQSRLALALQLRWDLTRQYWSTIARRGAPWPLEDLPWRTTDGLESDYFSCQVLAIVVRDFVIRQAPEADLVHAGAILTELASRGRVTRRPVVDDPALRLHVPGLEMRLYGPAELDEPREWVAVDFAPLLLKLALSLAAALADVERRAQMLDLADRIWDHLAQRRLTEPYDDRRLWDQPAEVFDQVTDRYREPSWRVTEPVVQALALAAVTVSAPPTRSPRISDYATDLLAEAEQLYDRELLRSHGNGQTQRDALLSVAALLRRGRQLAVSHPATASALALRALVDLDRLDAARQQTAWYE